MQIKSFFTIILCFFGFIVHTQSKNDTKPFVVVLDAGHGGKDPGRPTSYGYTEKDIVLDIAIRVGNLLESVDDIKVIFTRETDVFLELRARADIANKADADLFISIHCNAHNSQAHGTETYVLGLHRNESNFKVAQKENEVIFFEDDYDQNYQGFNPSSPESIIGLTLLQEDYLDQSILLATNIQDNFTKKLKRKNRGVKQAGFWVLHNTYMPSVLVETGFITNKNEGDYLNSEKGKIEVSNSIFEAIIQYKSSLNRSLFVNDSSTMKQIVSSEIIYKVQISASSKKIALESFNFKGLKSLSREKSGKLFRYFYGETNNYKTVLRMQKEAVSVGFAGSFVVAYKDGVRISVKKALKN